VSSGKTGMEVETIGFYANSCYLEDS
jgi:hypothetical protein